MGEYHRPSRVLQRLGRSPRPGVRDAEYHPHPLHLVDDRSADTGEAGIGLIEASGAGRVAVVVGDQHPAHAELVESLYQALIALDGTHPLDVEDDSELSLPLAD